jgi:hypothetical protein
MDLHILTTKPPASPVPAATVGGITVTLNEAKAGVEIRFPSKPAADVLARLRAHGWRWSRFSSCWYQRDTPTARTFAEEVATAQV